MMLATMSALALAGPALAMLGPDGYEITPEERAYLNTLERGARDIWHRRLVRGLTKSERAFFDKKMAGVE
jgi:hypothetical protein